MTKNPYESPGEDESPQVEEALSSSWFDIAYIPLGWAVLLFVLFVFWGVTATGDVDVPLFIKIISSLFTASALVILAVSIRGWKRLITAPLWVHLIWVQYLIWTFYANR